jgi:hypothetical protein
MRRSVLSLVVVALLGVFAGQCLAQCAWSGCGSGHHTAQEITTQKDLFDNYWEGLIIQDAVNAEYARDCLESITFQVTMLCDEACDCHSSNWEYMEGKVEDAELAYDEGDDYWVGAVDDYLIAYFYVINGPSDSDSQYHYYFSANVGMTFGSAKFQQAAGDFDDAWVSAHAIQTYHLANPDHECDD